MLGNDWNDGCGDGLLLGVKEGSPDGCDDGLLLGIAEGSEEGNVDGRNDGR